MKLYYSKGACSLAVRIILNEIGINFESESVNLRNKKTSTGKNFLEITTKGSVPALELDNHDIITEAAVILQYLADREQVSNLLPPIGNFQRYKVLEILNYLSTDLHKNISVLFNPMIPKELKDSVFLPIVQSKLNFVNNILNNNKYLAGDTFTLPDAYLFVIMQWMPIIGIALNEYPAINTYISFLSNRDSINKSLQQEENN